MSGGEKQEFVVVLENMDELDSHVLQAEIALVIKYLDGIYDDRVRPDRQEKED